MDRSFLSGILVAGSLMALTFTATDAQDQHVRIDEDYYQNDIDSAVREAERNRRNNNFDYSNRYWYNRTTAESFELPQMGSSDMEDARLEGALNPSAAGGQSDVAQPDLPNDEQADLVQTGIESEEQQQITNQQSQLTQPLANIPSTTGPTLVVEQNQHTFPRGDTVNIQSVYSSGSLTSTPRE